MTEKYRFISAEKASHPVALLCRVLGVSRSAYYASLSAVPSARSLANARLTADLVAAHAASKGRYGAPRLHRAIGGNAVASRGRVQRLMKARGIEAVRRRRFRHTTDSNHRQPVADNLLARTFTTEGPDRIWVADVTYIDTSEGWVYLAVVIDLWSRRVVGWSMGQRNDRHLVLAAFRTAWGMRAPAAGLIHHSDRGSTYASTDFRAELRSRGAIMSMSRKGDCWDNAVAESFFSTLKTELVRNRRYPTRNKARAAITAYIGWYNTHRLHSTLDYVSPAAYEGETPVMRYPA